MKPILEAINEVKLALMNDPEDGDLELHLAQLQNILLYGVSFETLVDHDSHVVRLTTMGMSYKCDTEMTFEFERMAGSNLSMLTACDTIKLTIVKALEDKAFVFDRLQGLDYITVKEDGVGVRHITPNQFENPCYGGEQYNNHHHIVTIDYGVVEE